LPAGVFWKAGISAAYASLGVEYATRLRLPPEELLLPPQPATTAARAAMTAPTARNLDMVVRIWCRAPFSIG
jgi:hypothetical protein